MNIILASLYTPGISAYARPIAAAKERYCNQHGYEFACPVVEDHELQRPASWYKVQLLLYLFATHAPDYIFWTDADSIITDPSKRLEEFITDHDHDLIIARNSGPGVNCGNFFVKNTPQVIDFLNDVWHCDPYYYHRGIWEQSQFSEILSKGEHRMDVDVVDFRKFNSYSEFWKPGDFMCHVAGVCPKSYIYDYMERAGI